MIEKKLKDNKGDFIAHLLNRNNQLNEKGEDSINLELSTVDDITQTGEVTGLLNFPFPLNSEMFLKIVSCHGLFKVYRIQRFSPLLFNVDFLKFEFFDNNVITKYESKQIPSKTLFPEYEMVADLITHKGTNFEFRNEVINLNQLGEIMINEYKEVKKEYFENIFKRAIQKFFLGTDIENGEWYNNIKFH